MQCMPGEQDKGAALLVRHQQRDVQPADDCSAMVKYQVVQTATKRTGIVYIVPSTRESECALDGGAQLLTVNTLDYHCA